MQSVVQAVVSGEATGLFVAAFTVILLIGLYLLRTRV